MKTYFLPINTNNLFFYFQYACIMPRKYFQNTHNDVQNKYEAFLLLNSKNVRTKEENCSLELVFDEDEAKKMIKLNNDFCLYPMPLPISRVKHVLFLDINQKETTITNIEMSTAFVPKKIIKISSIKKEIELPSIEKEEENDNDWTSNIKEFDRLLGGFSLMKLAGGERNYSENYFSTLSFFNKKIKNEIIKNKKEISEKYFDVFIGEKQFAKLLPLIKKPIEEHDIEMLAIEEKQELIKNSIGGIDLSKLEKMAYVAAVLYTYKVGDETGYKKIDTLIRTNFQEVKKGEGIALYYGLNRGYYVFNNEYKEKIVKFQLNSQLDYYTIESLYQYAFNGMKSNDFPYLDDWCPKLKQNKSIKEDYKILDVVVGEKKPEVLSQKFLANSLSSFLQIDKLSEKKIPELFQEFVEMVYQDTKNELEDDFETQKQEEIENLRNNYEMQIAVLQEENERVNSDLKQLEQKDMTPSKPYLQKEEVISIVAEPQTEYNSQSIDKSTFILTLKNYKNKKRSTIEKDAKELKISIDGEMTDEEIIWMIVEKKQKNFFRNG